MIILMRELRRSAYNGEDVFFDAFVDVVIVSMICMSCGSKNAPSSMIYFLKECLFLY